MTNERRIQELENQFPLASGAAFAAAREQALEAGQAVLQTENGVLFKVYPNGTKEFVKRIEPPIQITPGNPIKIW